jgi:hypothetical protein
MKDIIYKTYLVIILNVYKNTNILLINGTIKRIF